MLRERAPVEVGRSGATVLTKARWLRTTVQRRPARVLPGAGTGTGVSSTWMRDGARTGASILSTTGASQTGTAPTQVGLRAVGDRHTLTGEALALPVERQVHAVHGGDDLRKEFRPHAIG